MTGRRLILIRHAKAEAGAVDLERPLAPRGESDAAAAGRLLARAGVVPDRAVLSPARRVRQTWDAVRAGLAVPVEVLVDERVYHNDVATLFQVVADAEAEAGAIGCLALVGHNPSFAEFAITLDDGQGDRDARQRLRAGYPTSGVAVFELTGGWDALAPKSATLRSFDIARGTA
ncbi:MAG TPA: histidine phosphatase family protein [Jatrophihabitans sp.]|uniref:SixA phosphatase family protein n=1 Tax=Jatrophihabitans sp. TaxID=1932789 RepID=UPI002EE0875D